MLLRVRQTATFDDRIALELLVKAEVEVEAAAEEEEVVEVVVVVVEEEVVVVVVMLVE